ncbi:hypothetical protein EWM64_g1456 [Hericium alpestre]|uniref:Hydrogen voltage-gated channel 1 n=1 Tax=Hericium alpestre TaxID=135208 RepID=A0A4Z0A6A4_9AGAM|nr:hypothetical protein EWM64_g1456 [Hericium alpestre]
MSEQDPLLPPPDQRDPEGGGNSVNRKWRSRVAEALESSTFHKLVIFLIVVDAACGLTDLAYTLLSDTCEAPAGPDAPWWLEVLSDISTGITTIFLVEIPLSLWALGLQFYNPFGCVPHASLHLFDGIIIVTTFVLEVILRGKERELASLLIILRLWRLIKVVGGVAVGAGELEEEDVKELIRVKMELETTQSALSNASRENDALRQRLARWENTNDSEL